MRTYLLPRLGKFYKANMHTHTCLTTNGLTPSEAKEIYASLGYSIVAFTNHELLIAHDELKDESFLPLLAMEITIPEPVWSPFAKCYHFGIIMPNSAVKHTDIFSSKFVKKETAHLVTEEMESHGTIDREYTKSFAQRIIDTAKKEGCLVAYNHPAWSNQNYADYSGLKGIWGVEWYNNTAARIGSPDNFQPIDDLLREGENVFPLATDDTHGRDTYGGGWISVKARELEYGAVFAALKKGDFYSSTGPEIKSLYSENGKVIVKTSRAKCIRLISSTRIGKSIYASDKLLTEAEFDLSKLGSAQSADSKNREIWFIIEVTDKKGDKAVTRAYSIDECK